MAYCNYILLGIFALGALIAALMKGFWGGLTRIAALTLAVVAGLLFANNVAGMIDASGAGALIGIGVIGIVAGLAFFELVKRCPKSARFLPAGADLGAGVGAALAAAGAAAFLSKKLPGPFLEGQLGAGGEGVKVTQGAIDLLPSIPLFAVMVLMFALWAFVGSWAEGDLRELKKSADMPWKLVLALVFPIALTVTILFFGSSIAVGAAIVAAAAIIPSLAYVIFRNSGLPPGQKVMTPGHLARLSRGKGNKKKKQEEAQWTLPIELFGYGSGVSKSMRAERGEAAKAITGCVPLCDLVYRALKRKATALQILPGAEATSVKYQLDGLWQEVPGVFAPPIRIDRYKGVVQAMKALLGAVPADEPKGADQPAEKAAPRRLAGEIYMEYDNVGGKKKKMAAQVLLAPQPTGEAMQITFKPLAQHFKSLEHLGMSKQRADLLRGFLRAERGLVILAAPPAHGLRTFTHVALSSADRFTRDFTAVEDLARPYDPVENAVRATYDSRQGQTPMNILSDVFFKEPRVLVIRDLVNRETLEYCCREIQNDRLIITTVRARNSADAILQILRMGIDPKLLADSLIGVVTQRLIRVLCPFCKEPAPVNPEVLRHIGIHRQSIDTFYRPHSTDAAHGEKVCDGCMGFGFKTRKGIYDILTVTDNIRRILVTQPSEQAIHAEAAKGEEYGFATDGGRFLLWGVTSYEELVRCLK